jgi:hypothetical protein
MRDKPGDVGINLTLKSVRITIIAMVKQQVVYMLSGCLYV